MKKKIALITGISGQDGAYLAKFLLSKSYTVIGADRRSSRNDGWRLKELGIEDKILIEDLDILEPNNINRILNKYKFDEIYNLAAQSFVQSSFANPIYTSNVTAIAPLYFLELIRNLKYKPKFYQASSSEMFGAVKDHSQNENSVFNPQSPYAVSKLFAHHIVKIYRDGFNIFAVSGILFNHESPLRGEEFITRKITKGLVLIKKNKKKFIEVGNIYAKRDWGFAEDYVKAMWKMLQQKKATDFCIATGKNYTVKYFITKAANYLGLKVKWQGKGIKEKLIDIKTNKTIVKINPIFFRPAEVNFLKGDYKKAKKILKWKPKTEITELIKKMINYDLKINF